jgi:hypothetical protein
MGARHVRYWMDASFIKEGSSAESATPWHNDECTFPFRGEMMPSFWVALTDVPMENAPIVTLAGSNRDPWRYHSPMSDPAAATQGAAPDPSAPSAGNQAQAPKPTLQDVDQLDAQSDYRSFVARDVDPEVRNAAFKKLFHSDPHFNVMDGLDVYIDDYNTPNPLPVAVMKTLVQARALGLIDDELKEQEPPVGKGLGSAKDPNGDAARDAARDAEPDAPAPALTQDAEMPAAEVPAEAELVELKLVPDRASNDEPISGAAPVAATAEGTVVPFPGRPGRAGPA